MKLTTLGKVEVKEHVYPPGRYRAAILCNLKGHKTIPGVSNCNSPAEALDGAIREARSLGVDPRESWDEDYRELKEKQCEQ